MLLVFLGFLDQNGFFLRILDFGFSSDFIHSLDGFSSDSGSRIAYQIRLNNTNIQLKISWYKRENAIFHDC